MIMGQPTRGRGQSPRASPLPGGNAFPRRVGHDAKDANGKQRTIGIYDTQEDAARAYNAAIRRAGLEGRRKTNPVVDGQLVPKPPRKPPSRKRRRDESTAAAPSPRARRRR